ncbi:MAG: aminopeptidase P family protein [Deltaproteobacteria bacterium]|nr:aminopeptidase P family protein [Deltaproteobacteria bacterium]MBI3078118.1 aminopeptidase P family protein [Deltaproteobacteria bacterium]
MRDPTYLRFPQAEYVQRWERARALMDRTGLEALFITEGGNFTYLAGGTRDFSYTRPTVLLFPRDGAPVAFVQMFPREIQRRQCWVEELRVYRSLTGVPVDEIRDAFCERRLERSRVGAELGFEQRLGISPHDFRRLQEALPQVEFVDAAPVLWALRMVKSEAEIGCVRRACAITSAAYDRLFPRLRLGMDEVAAARIFTDLHTEAGARPWLVINSCPDNYAVLYGGPTTRRLEPGNVLWIDGGCTANEYYSDFSRLAFLGPPTERQRALHEMVLEITKTCVAAIRPGVRASELWDLNWREWQKRGYDYAEIDFAGGRIGHGMGLMLTEPPHIAPYDQTVLQPGMVVTMEPAIVTAEGCFHVEENILVTEHGPELLSNASRVPIIIE